MRPKKIRWVKCLPTERCFRPAGRRPAKLAGVTLSLDEFESVRLTHWERQPQSVSATRMHVSRPTFSRILASAHRKLADALVNIRAIKIEGGCCRIAGSGRPHRPRSGS